MAGAPLSIQRQNPRVGVIDNALASIDACALLNVDSIDIGYRSMTRVDNGARARFVDARESSSTGVRARAMAAMVGMMTGARARVAARARGAIGAREGRDRRVDAHASVARGTTRKRRERVVVDANDARAAMMREARCGARVVARAGGGDGDSDGDGVGRARALNLGAVTETLSLVAMVPLTLLTAPQIVKNYAFAQSGDLAAIGALSWQGYAAGLLANMLLLSYFADRRETTATAAQAIGVVTTFVLLAQIAMSGHMSTVPPAALGAACVAILGGLGLSAARFLGVAFPGGWHAYQNALGIFGLLAAPQIISNALTPFMGWTPTVMAAAAAAYGSRSQAMAKIWGVVGGWTATALFMAMPVAQIAMNVQHPELLKGLSITTSVLVMSGNALMLSRALYVRDAVWITGSAWGAFVGGWGVLATLFASTNPETSAPYLAGSDFSIITVVLFVYTACVLKFQLDAWAIEKNEN